MNFTQAAEQVAEVERRIEAMQPNDPDTADIISYGRVLIDQFRDSINADDTKALFTLYQIQAFGIALRVIKAREIFTVGATLLQDPPTAESRPTRH